MRIHGLDVREGDTAFAFLVLRLDRPVGRATIRELATRLGAMLAGHVVAPASEDDGDADEPLVLVTLPWNPPDDERSLAMQHQLVGMLASDGVLEAWFFQTGTSLPSLDDDDGDDDGDDDDDDDDDDDLEDDDDFDDDDLEVAWSHGAPPQALSTRFPVDGYPDIIDELDWEDVGIAVKLEGTPIAGEYQVLLAFHALWLAPYGGRQRNAAVTYDRTRHAAHLWVDRFAVPSSSSEQVRHLLWIVSKLDEVLPVEHAAFKGATMSQKYAELLGDESEPFVLGGNPLLALHAEGGEAAVDAWVARQTVWSSEEVALMLRELAIELVTSSAEASSTPPPRADADARDARDDDAAADDDDDVDEAGRERPPGSRRIARFAAEVLAARARAGKLDPRAADQLRPLLATSRKYEHRRREVATILGALRDRASVDALTGVLDEVAIADAMDSVGKEDLIVRTAEALGAIGDPAAVPSLAKVVRAPGDHNDEPRPVAAHALATCLAATSEPRDVDDAVLGAMLEMLERSSGDDHAELYVAYGRLAKLLPAPRRHAAHARLAAVENDEEDESPRFAREIALALAAGPTLEPGAAAALRPLMHEALTHREWSHESTVTRRRLALKVAHELPSLVDAEDVVWLTRFGEADVREQAHALLDRLGAEQPPAYVADPWGVRVLGDTELVRLIGEPHVVNRATLIDEARRRGLVAARRAIVAAAHDVITEAPEDSRDLLDPQSAILEASVKALRSWSLDAETIALFDRMLRSSNRHVKWELMQDPPEDVRLVEGMFAVLREGFAWQAKAAKQWLEAVHGSTGPDDAAAPDEDDEDDDEPAEQDDEDIN